MDKKIYTADVSKYLCFVAILALPFSWISGSFGSVYRVLVILLIALDFILKRCTIDINPINRGFLIAWTVHTVYAVARSLVVNDVRAGLSGCMGIGLIWLMAVMFAGQYYDDRDRRNLENLWIFVGLFIAIIYLTSDRVTVTEYSSRMALQIFGTITDPNEFSTVFIVTIPVCVKCLFDRRSSFVKAICAADIFLDVYCAFLGGSRGVFVSLIASCLLILIINFRFSLATVVKIAVVCIAAYLVIVRLILPTIASDILERLTIESALEDGGSSRLTLWTDALYQISHGSTAGLVFGYGPGKLVAGLKGGTSTMHNQFLQELADYGIIGLGLYVTFIVFALSSMKKNNPDYFPALVGMLVMSMVLTMGSQVKPFWVFLMVAFLGEKEETEEAEETNEPLPDGQ